MLVGIVFTPRCACSTSDVLKYVQDPELILHFVGCSVRVLRATHVAWLQHD